MLTRPAPTRAQAVHRRDAQLLGAVPHTRFPGRSERAAGAEECSNSGRSTEPSPVGTVTINRRDTCRASVRRNQLAGVPGVAGAQARPERPGRSGGNADTEPDLPVVRRPSSEVAVAGRASPREDARQEDAGTTSKRRRGRPSMPHLRSLDGLRGLAVLLVVLYHFSPGIAPGGFLGVDVFFVLSGFLITSLLVIEWEKKSRISLPAFWARRARRLLPALLLLLAACGICGGGGRCASPGPARRDGRARDIDLCRELALHRVKSVLPRGNSQTACRRRFSTHGR